MAEATSDRLRTGGSTLAVSALLLLPNAICYRPSSLLSRPTTYAIANQVGAANHHSCNGSIVKLQRIAPGREIQAPAHQAQGTNIAAWESSPHFSKTQRRKGREMSSEVMRRVTLATASVTRIRDPHSMPQS